MTVTRARRSDRFLKALAGKRTAVVTHDNPDPDAIASGWALLELLRHTHDQEIRLIGRGAIVGAENLHLVRLLEPPLELVDDLPRDGTAIVLVDCLPTGGNHLLNGNRARPVVVIDHNDSNGGSFRADFRDVRPRAVATAVIAASYLREQKVVPEGRLATALLYAIRTKCAGRPSSLNRTDRSIITWLSDLADHAKLAEIVAAPLSRDYFSDLAFAIENVVVHENAAVCLLPQASGMEIVGELADLLVRCDGINKVLCGAAVENDLVLTARTTPEGGDVLPLLRATISGFGHCGGQKHRAGGKILSVSADGRAGELLFGTLKACWLSACEVDRQQGSPLVRKPLVQEGEN